MKKLIPKHLERQWLNYLSKHKEIKSVTVFGSRARGDNDVRSDIDLVISAPSATQKQWLDAFFFFKDDSDTLVPIDVVRWEEASKPLKTKIKQEGRPVYERNKP